MNKINWKQVSTWAVSIVSPIVGEWLPDMLAGNKPDVNIWHSLALALIG